MIEETTALKPNDFNDFNDFNSGKDELSHLSHLSQPVPNSERAVEITDEDRYTITPKGLAYLEGTKDNG